MEKVRIFGQIKKFGNSYWLVIPMKNIKSLELKSNTNYEMILNLRECDDNYIFVGDYINIRILDRIKIRGNSRNILIPKLIFNSLELKEDINYEVQIAFRELTDNGFPVGLFTNGLDLVSDDKKRIEILNSGFSNLTYDVV
jgi:antitoxin component of MazEF toxin-antitoxin module